MWVVVYGQFSQWHNVSCQWCTRDTAKELLHTWVIPGEYHAPSYTFTRVNIDELLRDNQNLIGHVVKVRDSGNIKSYYRGVSAADCACYSRVCDLFLPCGMWCNAWYCCRKFVCLSVRRSVRLSVRCVYCDKTKWWAADILILHERAITLVFWHQQWLAGDTPFPVKYSPKVTHPLRRTPTSTDFRS